MFLVSCLEKPNQDSKDLQLCFSSKDFIVLVLVFRTLTILSGFCIWCEVGATTLGQAF